MAMNQPRMSLGTTDLAERIDHEEYRGRDKSGRWYRDEPCGDYRHEMSAPDKFPLTGFSPSFDVSIRSIFRVECDTAIGFGVQSDTTICDEFPQKPDAKYSTNRNMG
jgi:hypothetical protein